MSHALKGALAGALALSLIGGSAALAQPRHGPPPGPPPGDHHWRSHERLPPEYRTGYVDDWQSHRLRRPPRGYRWVRHNDQYLLTAVATGLIASAIAANR